MRVRCAGLLAGLLIIAALLPACAAAPAAAPDLQAYEGTVVARVVSALTAGAPPPTVAPSFTSTPTLIPTATPTLLATATATHTPTPTRTPAPTQPPTPASTPTQTPTIRSAPVVPLHQVFEIAGWSWSLVAVAKTNSIPTDTGPIVAQGSFLLVSIQFTNTANALQRPSSIEPLYLLDARGYWRPLSLSETTAGDAVLAASAILQASPFKEVIRPGDKQIALAAWDLPAGSGDLFLLLGNHRIYLGDFDAMVAADTDAAPATP